MNVFFDDAFNYLLRNEGTTFTDDPTDSGGPTKFGITKKAYELFLGHSVDVSEIRSLTIPQAKPFYFDRYWKTLSCQKLTSRAISICIFDSGVLYGVANAGILAQKAASANGFALKFDGILGDKSIAALNAIQEEDFLKSFHSLLLERIEWIVKVNPKNVVYQKGWTDRADRLLRLS